MTPIQATAIWSEKLNSLSKKNKSLNNWNDSPRTRKSQFIKMRTKSILKGNMNYKDEISQWKLKGLIRELCFAVYVCTYVYGGGWFNLLFYLEAIRRTHSKYIYRKQNREGVTATKWASVKTRHATLVQTGTISIQQANPHPGLRKSNGFSLLLVSLIRFLFSQLSQISWPTIKSEPTNSFLLVMILHESIWRLNSWKDNQDKTSLISTINWLSKENINTQPV